MASITFNSQKSTTASAFQVIMAVTSKKICTLTSQLDVTQQIEQSSVSSNNRIGNETSRNGKQSFIRCKHELTSHGDATNQQIIKTQSGAKSSAPRSAATAINEKRKANLIKPLLQVRNKLINSLYISNHNTLCFIDIHNHI